MTEVNHTAGIRYIDSHTGGEPTRVVVAGGPDLGDDPVPQRLERLRRGQDSFRQTVINEPRGWEAVVGALLCEPSDPSCAAGVIFFNNTGYLGMCGHGAIGVAVTLQYLGRIKPGKQRLETPVGIVEVELLDPHRVAIENVPSFRYRSDVSVKVDGIGDVTGDIAWGGNWFYLTNSSPAPLTGEYVGQLTDAARRVRQALEREGITGQHGAEIDHIEFFGPPLSADAHSRNFVYCPGGAFDRSPCGTGTSAKVACLVAGGKLAPGEMWVQESIIGSRFEATYRLDESNQVIPRIVGQAYICGEGTLIQQAEDPYRHGIQASWT